jgi:type VI secretion system protein ImpH
MAAEDGRGDSDLEQTLLEAPFRFGFFQAVRMLSLIIRRKGLQPVRGVRELIRFRTPLSLEFPASEIHSLKKHEPPSAEDEEEAPTLEMTVNFMGLTGPSGVLPRHYTETLIAATQHFREPGRPRELPAHSFFDIFSHRIISLFAGAWAKYRFWLAYERGDPGSLTRNLLDLTGLGTDHLRGRLRDEQGNGLRDEAIAYYSGLLSQHPYSCSAVAAVVSDYFGTEVAVEQFRGRWLALSGPIRTMLGKSSTVLGDSLFLGDRAWDQQSTFRVRIGPLSWQQFEDLLPSGRGYSAMTKLIKFCAGISLDVQIQLVLKKAEVPACVLRTDGGGRLGWSSWLRAQDASTRRPVAFDRDADDVVLAL